MVIWLNDSIGSLGVEDGIVRAEDVQQFLALEECRRMLVDQQEQVLQAAREQAEALLAQAHEQAAVLLAASRSDGYEEGHRRAVQEWQARQIGLAIDKGQALRALHKKLAGIVTGAVERIVHTESREALYLRALDNVDGLTEGATSLDLRVNPADYEEARNALAALPEPPHGVSMQVTSDDSLPPGSCVFESDLGVLDASLHTQLEGLRGAMDRAVRTAMADLHAAPPAGEAGMMYGEQEQQDDGEFADADDDGHYPDQEHAHG